VSLVNQHDQNAPTFVVQDLGRICVAWSSSIAAGCDILVVSAKLWTSDEDEHHIEFFSLGSTPWCGASPESDVYYVV
jgi:hypothetical protein